MGLALKYSTMHYNMSLDQASTKYQSRDSVLVVIVTYRTKKLLHVISQNERLNLYEDK